MTIVNDTFRTVLWNDGEGLTHGDLNATGLVGLARVTDQLLGRTAGVLAQAGVDPDIGGEGGDDIASTSLVYTLTAGDAVLSTANNSAVVTILAGTIFQRIGAANGASPTFLPFTLRDGDLSFTLAANAAGNPRIDIVQVKLDVVSGDPETRDFKDAVTGALTTSSVNKSTRVRATVTVKQGAPGATPAYPALDAGYALLGAVRLPAGWTAPFGIVANSNLEEANLNRGTVRQCSVPLRVTQCVVTPKEFDYAAATNWGRDVTIGGATSGMAVATGAGSDLLVDCPSDGRRRIVGVTVVGRFVASAAVVLETYEYTPLVGQLEHDACDLTAVLSEVGSTKAKTAHLGQIADASGDSNPSAAAGPVGDPYWSVDGKAGPSARSIQEQFEFTSVFSRARLRIGGGDGSFIVAVLWYLAG